MQEFFKGLGLVLSFIVGLHLTIHIFVNEIENFFVVFIAGALIAILPANVVSELRILKEKNETVR